MVILIVIKSLLISYYCYKYNWDQWDDNTYTYTILITFIFVANQNNAILKWIFFDCIFFYLKIGSEVGYVYPIFERKCQFQTQTAWYISNHGYIKLTHIFQLWECCYWLFWQSHIARDNENFARTDIYHSLGPDRKVPTAILKSSFRGSPCICAPG